MRDKIQPVAIQSMAMPLTESGMLDTPPESRTPWYRKLGSLIALLLLSPILVLPLTILLALGLYAVVHNFVSEFLFRFRMAHCGRFLRRRQLSARIAAEGSGTLIVERPSLGWGFTHAWWTPKKSLRSARMQCRPPTITAMLPKICSALIGTDGNGRITLRRKKAGRSFARLEWPFA